MNRVEIDLARDLLLTPHALKMLKDRYILPKKDCERLGLPEETSPQHAFARAASAFADDDDHAQRMYDYVSKHWFMYATPVLSNGGTDRGLPISCFLNYVPDSREGLTDHYTENSWLSSVGGGIGSYWGHVRPAGSKTKHGSESSGIIPFVHIADGYMLGFSQGVTRRGSNAVYLDMSHPEIEEFLEIRKQSGDLNRKALNLHHGVNIPDAFMEIIERRQNDASASDDWPLIDPNTGETVEVVSAVKLWKKILEMRMATGEPYMFFIDAANRALPEPQKKLGLRVHQSNLCTEITLPTNEERTAVCCLSSVNAEKYDEWKDDDRFIPDLVRFLDNVIQAFIDTVRAKYPALEKAAYSAERERSIGIGIMGMHAYFQSKMLPFATPMALGQGVKITKHIKDRAVAASLELGAERGEAPDMAGTGMRNAHLMAIAPNASSGIIAGETSPGIEPYAANVFTKKTLSGSDTSRNRYLDKLLREKSVERFSYPHDRIDEERDDWVQEQWNKVLEDEGSVMGLECLDEWEKDVFRTAWEIDQRWIVEHAAARTPLICQAQSVNVFLTPETEIYYLHEVHFGMWKKGLKAAYYCRSQSVRRAENIMTKIPVRHRDRPSEASECLACES